MAQLKAEIADELERDAIRQELLAERRPAPPKTRGKLSPEALAEHIRCHALDKRRADGTPFSVNDRRRALQKEQGIAISRSRLTVRLNKLK